MGNNKDRTKNPKSFKLSRPLKPNDWFMYQIFYIVAESRTFFDAERKTGFSFHYISKILAKLEHATGLKLLLCGKNRIELTIVGRKLYEELKKTQDTINNANQTLEKAYMGHIDAPLKMGAPYYLATALLSPFGYDMAKEFPDLKIQLDIIQRDNPDTLYNYDCALFLGDVARKNVCADFLYMSKPGIYASEDYFKKNGIPKSLDELLDTNDIVTSCRKRDFDKPAPDWIKPFEDNYNDSAVITSHIEHTIKSILSGKGFGILPNDYTLSLPIQQILFNNEENERYKVYFIYPEAHKDYENIQRLKEFLLKLTAPLR